MNLTKEEIKSELKTGIYEVTFNKAGTGEPRTLKCTLDPRYLPEAKAPVKVRSEPKTDVVAVYEVELEAWRSFNAANVTEVRLISL